MPTVFLHDSSFRGTRYLKNFISMPAKSSFAGNSGDLRFTIVSHNTRHARIYIIAIRFAKRSGASQFEIFGPTAGFQNLMKCLPRPPQGILIGLSNRIRFAPYRKVGDEVFVLGSTGAKSEIDQPALIKLGAKALGIAGNLVTVSHG